MVRPKDNVTIPPGPTFKGSNATGLDHPTFVQTPRGPTILYDANNPAPIDIPEVVLFMASSTDFPAVLYATSICGDNIKLSQ